MAKRVRGNRSAYRPGGQGPGGTKQTSEGATSASDDLTAATESDEIVGGVTGDEVEVDEAAVAALAAATPPTATSEPTPKRESKRARRRERRRSTKQRSDDLAARAAAENVWVREDLRRIGIVSVILLVALALAWVVFGMLDVLSLY